MRRHLLGTILTLVVLLATAPLATAETRPIQVSLFDPIQIFPKDDSVKGIRLNLIYGSNQDVKGLDLGLVNHTRGDGKGIQYGPIGYTEGDFTGWQSGTVTITQGVMTGVQTAAFTKAGAGEVFQWGLINVGENISGFQLGVINYSKRLHGLQIGLLNIIKSKDKLPVFPIVNWSF